MAEVVPDSVRKMWGEPFGPWKLGEPLYDENTGEYTQSVFDTTHGQVFRHCAQWKPTEADMKLIESAPELRRRLDILIHEVETAVATYKGPTRGRPKNLWETLEHALQVVKGD